MTPLPKKKHTRSRSNKRKNSSKLSIPNLMTCSNCKKLKYYHKSCSNCGYYK